MKLSKKQTSTLSELLDMYDAEIIKLQTEKKAFMDVMQSLNSVDEDAARKRKTRASPVKDAVISFIESLPPESEFDYDTINRDLELYKESSFPITSIKRVLIKLESDGFIELKTKGSPANGPATYCRIISNTKDDSTSSPSTQNIPEGA